MPKAIALFIDGTWNSSVAVRKAMEAAMARNDLTAYEDEAATDTNVAKLYDACLLTPCGSEAAPAAAAAAGIKKYLVGVGGLPEEPQGGLARAAWQVLRRTVRPAALTGGAFGLGLARIVKDAYAFLCQHYQPGDGIYLFGFSRGAYAARSLAGFVDRVGLLLSSHTADDTVEAAFLHYQAGHARRESDLGTFVRELTGQRLLREGKVSNNEKTTFQREFELPIYFIGVWDTVASLGVDYVPLIGGITRPLNAYHRVDLPTCVTHARHALALHELRAAFRPVLWHHKSHPNQTLQQMVFRGAHADVGGGYPDTHWSDHALRWMVGEAIACRLPVADAQIPPLQAPDERRFIHCESARAWWRLGSRHRVPEFSECTAPLRFHWNATLAGLDVARVHDAVYRELQTVQRWARMRQDLRYATDDAGTVSPTYVFGSAASAAQADALRPFCTDAAPGGRRTRAIRRKGTAASTDGQ